MASNSWDAFLPTVDEVPQSADIISAAKSFFEVRGFQNPSSVEGVKESDLQVDGALTLRAFIARVCRRIECEHVAKRARIHQLSPNADVLVEIRDLSKSLRDTRSELYQLRHGGSASITAPRSAVTKARSSLHRDKVVVLIGMRGAGKTSLGRKIAEELKREYVDLDDVAEQVFGCKINLFVEKNGWEKFREEETQILKDVLLKGMHGAGGPNGAVVSCGGGIVESTAAVVLLKEYSPVVWVDRNIEDIVEYLEGSGAYRPSLGAHPREIYARRWAFYEKCSDFAFTIRKGDQDWPRVEADFVPFVRWAEGAPLQDVQLRKDSFVLPITFPSMEEEPARPGGFKELTKGVDVVEFRADLSRKLEDRAWLLDELALLRRHVFAPICFSVKTVEQGGKWTGDSQKTLELLKLAVKAGCEIIDVDADRFTDGQLAELMAVKGCAKFIGSHHSTKISTLPEFEQILRTLVSRGESCHWDILKVVQPAANASNVMAFHQCAARAIPGDRELILILQGDNGKLSRVINRTMTPVSADAGQDSMSELLQCRSMLSLFEPCKYFYIFGHPVAMSASPIMQNVGFQVNGKPHVYERYDTPSVEDVVWKLSLLSTGGGSVSIPHKESLVQYLDEVSDSVKAIGAANTITKEAGTGRLKGDNTDWIGIKEQLLPKIKNRAGDQVGLIIGAGGTARAAAYAFRSMGIKKIFVMNRTFERAETIAKEFGSEFVAVKDVAEMGDLSRLDAVMGTLPGQSNFTLPDGFLEKHKPAVIEAAYKSSDSGSRFTALLQQAVNAGCDIIEGIEMLFEQGVAQCEIWTGKSAPRKQIAQALLSARFANDSDPPKNLVFEANREA